MNEISTTNQIIFHHTEAQAHAQNAVDHAIQAGMLLAQAKASTEYGQWIPFLASSYDRIWCTGRLQPT